MANQFLALALFLMMLSFFIIMNGVSNFDSNKKELVLNSISKAFSNKDRKIGLAPIVEATAMQSIHTGDSLAEIEGLFESQITNFKASKNRLGTTMHVSLTYDEFKSALEALESNKETGENQQSFLPTMISLMRSEKSGVPYRVDMLLNTIGDPALDQTDNPAVYTENMKKISSLALLLEKSGLPKNLMTAGMQKGDANMLDLFFYRYQSYDSLSGDAVPNKKGKAL